MNVNLWFARDKHDEITTILNSNNENTYTCPICNSDVIPKALESKQVTPHFAHIDRNKCTGESFIHFWMKHGFIERGDTFTITSDKPHTFTCKDFKTEVTFNLESGVYRPDIVVETECGNEIVFEMAHKNKKKVQDYIDRWIELDKTVVEVDTLTLTGQNEVKEFKALYYKGRCFNFNKRDGGYYNTIGRLKEQMKSKGEYDIELVKKLDWFWVKLSTEEFIEETFPMLNKIITDDDIYNILNKILKSKKHENILEKFNTFRNDFIITKIKELESEYDIHFLLTDNVVKGILNTVNVKIILGNQHDYFDININKVVKSNKLKYIKDFLFFANLSDKLLSNDIYNNYKIKLYLSTFSKNFVSISSDNNSYDNKYVDYNGIKDESYWMDKIKEYHDFILDEIKTDEFIAYTKEYLLNSEELKEYSLFITEKRRYIIIRYKDYNSPAYMHFIPRSEFVNSISYVVKEIQKYYLKIFERISSIKINKATTNITEFLNDKCVYNAFKINVKYYNDLTVGLKLQNIINGEILLPLQYDKFLNKTVIFKADELRNLKTKDIQSSLENDFDIKILKNIIDNDKNIWSIEDYYEVKDFIDNIFMKNKIYKSHYITDFINDSQCFEIKLYNRDVILMRVFKDRIEYQESILEHSQEKLERLIYNEILKRKLVRNCVDCGIDYSIDHKEYTYFVSKELNLPKRCKSCRQKRKQNN